MRNGGKDRIEGLKKERLIERKGGKMREREKTENRSFMGEERVREEQREGRQGERQQLSVIAFTEHLW